MPTGGTANQILVKNSSTNYDTSFITSPYAPISSPTFTGTVVIPTATITNATVSTTPSSSTDVVNKTYSDSGTQTLTNKRINPRTTGSSISTSTTTLTPDVSSYDQYNFVAHAANCAIGAPTGTPVDGNKLTFRILDNGTTKTFTFDATYTSMIGSAFTNTFATTANKTSYIGCIYNAYNTRWDVVSLVTQA